SCSPVALDFPEDEWSIVVAIGGTVFGVARSLVPALAALMVGPVGWDDLMGTVGGRTGISDLLVALLDADVLQLNPDRSLGRSSVVDHRSRSRFDLPAADRLDEPTLVQIGPEPWPTRTVRGLNGSDEWEAQLISALENGDRGARETLRSHIEGFDLFEELSRTRSPRLARGRLGRHAPASLRGPSSVDEFIAGHDAAGAKLVVASDSNPLNQRAPDTVRSVAYSVYSPEKISPGRLSALIDRSVTAIILGIDESIAEIAEWVGLLERVARRRSGANAYISSGEAPGFGSHWDDHDVLIIQLCGTKGWEVYEPVERSPIRPTSPEDVSSRLVWAGDVHTGDVMYVPRGWGHRVTGSDSLSIHLTFPLRAVSAAMIAETALSTVQTGVADIPPGSGRWDVQLDSERVRRCVEEGLAYWRFRAPPRCHQDLWAASSFAARGAGASTPAEIRWAACTGLGVVNTEAAPGRRTLVAGGRTIDVTEDAGAVLVTLLDGEWHAIQDLTVHPDRRSVDDLLRRLAAVGLVELRAPLGAEG
ncbi:MAG: hypothetical protein KDB69_01485, partial [Acidimicrobiia bacterium]|nr:hypothetical protein [Acidimicrobiia bacterium]